MKRFLIFILSVFLCFQAYSQASKDLKKLAKMMSGSFNNLEQTARDSQFLRIQLKIDRIWHKTKSSSIWLYVEQALMKHADNPYRQRVYEVKQLAPNQFLSEVYLLKNPGLYISNLKGIENLTKDSLLKKAECSVYLEKKSNELFVGGTKGKACASELKGAKFATSEVEIAPQGMKTLDRGFNGSDKQVWGSERGAYDFKKLK